MISYSSKEVISIFSDLSTTEGLEQCLITGSMVNFGKSNSGSVSLRYFLKQSGPQGPRHIVAGDCFITRSIPMELMPESGFTASNTQKHSKFHLY